MRGRVVSSCWAVLLLVACGGATSGGAGRENEDPSGGAGSRSVGGNGGVDTPGAGGADAIRSGGCCLGIPQCHFGDTEIESPGECPPGRTCYQQEMCCSQITCLARDPPCSGPPACDRADREISACPENEPRLLAQPYSCYTREACDTLIHCAHLLPAILPPAADGGTCNPAGAPSKRYVGTFTECATLALQCGIFTTAFHDSCGCGCEQDPSCPPIIDCSPDVGEPSPVCANAGAFKCPLSTVVP